MASYASGTIVPKITADDLKVQYELGKRHGEDDLKYVERQNREQAREIQLLKRKNAELKMELAKLRNLNSGD